MEKKQIFEKKSHNAAKLKGGTLWLGFFIIHSVAKHQKIEGGNFYFWKKNLSETIERGDSLVSPGMVCYAEKQEKPFWFSSIGQMVQFGAIIFFRTFKNYSGQFVWIEKVTIIVAFHFMKRRLKIKTQEETNQ